MKSKALPAVIMLMAGFITCIIAVIQRWELFKFTYTLFIVLVLFYFIGFIIRVILDKALDYFDEPLSMNEEEDYFEALEREETLKKMMKEDNK